MSTQPEPASDVDSLRREREANVFPFSRSPFRHGFVPGGDEDSQQELPLKEGELRVRSPEEVPWIDLLLEIAMTTAFASLTDGTPILQWDNALSYLLYFVFVWWIWVAQVAYNMRFRQADWLHRIWVFAQLIVFSALAAFTKDFNVTNGLSSDSAAAQANYGYTASELAAEKFREQRLPRLNAQGISMVMAISRLVLLSQYIAVFFHAKRLKLSRTSLLVHMVPLLFSALCYFAAFAILYTGDTTVEPSIAVSSVKLVLWYFPILIEIASHYVALLLPGFVRYSTESIYARSGTVFLIILGAGLDKITGGFKSIVGNAGMGRDGIPLFVAAAVIFIGYFSLYFATPGSTRGLGNKRALTWFFSQFFFLAALVITLEGIATLLQFTNIFAAFINSFSALEPLFDWVNANPGLNLTTSNFNDAGNQFRKLGISLADVVDYINDYVTFSGQQNDSSIISAGNEQLKLQLVYILLTDFEALPDLQSPLAANLSAFITGDLNGTESYYEIWDGIIRDRGSSALWFYPAAGATILALVLMSFAKGLPRDKWEWGIILSRLLVGSGVLLLGFLSLGSSTPIYSSDGTYTKSLIWNIALSDSHWLLIIMAVAMGILQIMERLIAFLANRSYYSFNNVTYLLGADGIGQHHTTNSGPLPLSYSENPTYTNDPFDPYKALVKTQ